MYYILAVIIVAVWGLTFISTKELLGAGLLPSQIFAIRFVIAYIGIWLLSLRDSRQRKLFCSSPKDEAILFMLGITGGSLYFWTENTALAYTQACNVSFLVCTTPLVTMLLTIAVRKLFKGKMVDGLEKVHTGPILTAGTLLAITGMAMVVFDGNKLHLSAKGDLLAIGASLCWAVYSLFMGQMSAKYGSRMATRKVFFYGLLTILPVIAFEGTGNLGAVQFCSGKVIFNLAFLSIVASLFCFAAWNGVMQKLGNVTSSNFIYLNPVFTLIGAVLILGESMSLISGLGSALILGGVIIAGRSGSSVKED